MKNSFNEVKNVRLQNLCEFKNFYSIFKDFKYLRWCLGITLMQIL